MYDDAEDKGERTHPLFVLTMGDPAGIGPEIAVKAFQHPHFRDSVVIIGEDEIISTVAQSMSVNLSLNVISTTRAFKKGYVNVIATGQIRPATFTLGRAQAICGRAVFRYIEEAIALAMDGEVDGVITNPINKESLALAGLHYPGHTEIFAEKTHTDNFTMLFLLRNVGVAHVTTHCSLRHAIESISIDRVVQNIRLLYAALKQLDITAPRIAVGGLNPHAGENGLFGDEEIKIVKPAIIQAQTEGITVDGPYPPDTIFMRAFKGEFDGIVAMLHDHGFIALKSLDFEHGVNITIGLPIIRTSVGHGTAYSLAGKGIANPASLLAAYDAALRLYKNRCTIQ